MVLGFSPFIPRGPATRDHGIKTARSTSLLVFLFIAAGLAGCRQDMHDQPKYRGYRASDFFDDKRSVRAPIAGTVARGRLDDNEAFFTGTVGGEALAKVPFAVDREALERGRERFEIYCTPCHDRTGSGRGIVVQRGYKQPQSFHSDRLREMPVGYYFQVTTNGFGVMPSYHAQVSARDRWLIAAYVKTLQLSQHAAFADVPQSEQPKLEQQPQPAEAGEVPPND
jgi:mono/diheme cytochrome c family protein